MPTSRSSWWPSLAAILAYGVAILSVTTALVTGILLDQFLQTTPYVSLFLCSIMFAAWFGGLGPSLLATAIAVTVSSPTISWILADRSRSPPGTCPASPCSPSPHSSWYRSAPRKDAMRDSLRFARDELQATVQELARVNKALEAENARRRRVEAYLDEAQGLSRTGSFSWKVSSGDIFWSKEGYRMLELDRAAKPSIDLLPAGGPPGRPSRRAARDRARTKRGEQNYDYEYRWLTPSGFDEARPRPRPPRCDSSQAKTRSSAR